ncbi:nitroreductase/quinone reductase family protein [Salinactinospora qingdaonensis]|uniref:Nitroreductase family deazaflavin-dependent oxidoreductase n=1 Tax=Salinactinospora qingdaonensis TaxID=702744 RepID=A0ABP7FD89_9ACTN
MAQATGGPETRLRRSANAMIGELLKYGAGPAEMRLLTTRGNKSGFLRSTPVSLIENSQGRFLVAPYGAVGWVHNIRHDGFATLRRGGWIELVSAAELTPERAAPVLREYVDHPMRALAVRSHLALSPQASEAEFIEAAARRPVFEIVRSTMIRL